MTTTPTTRERLASAHMRDAGALDRIARAVRDHTSAGDLAQDVAAIIESTGRSIEPPPDGPEPTGPEPFTAWLTVAVPVLRHPDGTWSADGPPLMMEQYAHEPNTVTDENGLRLSDAERAAGQETAALKAAKTADPGIVPIEHAGIEAEPWTPGRAGR